jgi:hypothetical protein
MQDGKEQETIMAVSLNENWHDGKDFVIADLSSDTIFQLTQDKKLSPLIIRQPSVHNENPKIFLTPIIKSDKFIFLSECDVDFSSMKKNGIAGGYSKELLYHFLNREVYKASIINRDCPAKIVFKHDGIDIDKNMAASIIHAYEIVSYMEQKQIEGALLPIAKRLNAEDNPVVMIMKFK